MNICVQLAEDAGGGQWPPEHVIAMAFPPATGGKTEVMHGAMLDDSQGRP